MRFLLLIFLSTSIYAQKLIRNPYTDYCDRMNARAIANFDVRLEAAVKVKDHIIYYSPSHWIKFSMKTRLNTSVLKKVSLADGLDNMLDKMETDDYMSLAAYNIRMKVYLSKKVRWVSNMLITGPNTHSYYYTTGFSLKFK